MNVHLSYLDFRPKDFGRAQPRLQNSTWPPVLLTNAVENVWVLQSVTTVNWTEATVLDSH